MSELDPLVPEPAPEPVLTPEPVPEPEEPGAVVVGDQKLIPLSALLSEREKSKGLREKADQFDQMSGYVAQAKPYIEFLQAHPDVMTRALAPAPVAAPVAPAVDPMAEQLAKTLDLYTPEGKPDTARAQSLMTLIDTVAEQKAEAKVKPIADRTLKSKADENFQRALVTVAPNGHRVDPTVLRGLWDKLPAAVTADEQVASILVYSALGYDVMHKPVGTATAPLPTPVVTEGNTGRQSTPVALSTFDERIAAHRGIAPAKYGELLTGFTKGRPSALED